MEFLTTFTISQTKRKMSSTELMTTSPWREDIYNTKDEKCLNEWQSIVLKEVFKIAEKELREDERTREQALQQFKEWILKTHDIVNCLADENFLLRFLRVKKFSLPMAQQTLLKYLNFRKRFNHFMYNMDYTDPKVNELIRSGYIYVSPHRDSKGRRVVLYDVSKFDLNKYNSIDMCRAHAITYETLLCSEENQIMGLNHVGNLSGLSTNFIPLFSISDFLTIVRWGEQSFPMRHKEINLINLPLPLKYAYDFIKSHLSGKLKERFIVHDSKEELIKKVDNKCLPTEYGGSMPTKQMIDLWLDELQNQRERLLSFDRMNLLSDKLIITRKNPHGMNGAGDGCIAGSFRKLNID